MAESSPPAPVQSAPSPSPDLAVRTAPRNSASTPAANAKYRPISLDGFYQRRFADFSPGDSWAQVPQGETNFDGIPFLMFGKINLTGLGRARDGEFQPPRVGEIPVGHRASHVHLMHGASYDCPEDTPIASLLLRYESGETRSLFIRYGVHVRNWYVEATEVNTELTDPRSFVAWNGNTRSDGGGKPTRLFKTTFDNPLPGKAIRSIDLLSLFARANAVILAITLEDGSDSAAETVPENSEQNDDSSYRRELVVRTVDADTSQPISSINVKLMVAEGTRTYRFGNYLSDERGAVRIAYPPGRFEKLMLEVASPGYLSVNQEVTTEDGLFGPELRMQLKARTGP